MRDRHTVLREWRVAQVRLDATDGGDAELRAQVDRLRTEYQSLATGDPGEAAALARRPGTEPITDPELDAQSRRLLMEVEDLRRMEREKRATARSSPDFHEQAEAIEQKARNVFSIAREERSRGARDSPDPTEQAEQRPGDWTDGKTEIHQGT